MGVEVSNISLFYGQAQAVRSLDLSIPEGRSVVLLGKSGCGKTSTMRCIAGLEQPSAGSIRIGHKSVFDAAVGVNVPANKRDVGMVFQSYAIWPHRTVLQNVVFPLTMQRVKRTEARRRAIDMLEMVGLSAFADRGASQLSGGQMQRVALARSIVMRPQLLLLDEPLSNLDARLRDDLRVELRRIQQENGLTSLYVTHDQQEALSLGDEIAVMEGGRITQLASPQEVYERPASASIASFLGFANVFPVAKRTSPSEARLTGSGLRVVLAEGAAASGPASVCFRPEAVSVSSLDDGDEPAGNNSWTGQVAVAVFQGQTVRYRVDLADGVQFDCVTPYVGGPYHEIGSKVRVRVPEHDVLLLPDEMPEVDAAETGETRPVATDERTAVALR